jgi:cysteine synthase
MNKYTVNNYVRINKTAARNAFNKGEKLVIVPCFYRPNSWLAFHTTTEDSISETFDSLVNAFQFYNCNGETGNYAAFYKEI